MSKIILSDQEVARLIDKGHALEAEGRLDEAMQCYMDAIPLAPNPARAHLNYGNVLLLKGDLIGALDAFSIAIKHKPDYAGAYYNIGNALLGSGQLEKAVENYHSALEIQPDYAEVHCSLGVALKELGQLDDAIASFQSALEINPDLAEGHTNLDVAIRDICSMGNVLMGNRQLEAAVAKYHRVLEIKPDFAEAHCNLGNTLLELGQHKDAEASYRRALEISPDSAEVYGNLGTVLCTLGRQDEALACFQQQVRLTPENDVALHLIASLTGNNTERAPIRYVQGVFDNYADKFDTHLQQTLKYETPEKLVALIMQHSKVPIEKWKVLDLGCGTGLVGKVIAPFAKQLVGVDLSAKMLEKADARKLYQRLECMDLLTMMRDDKTSSYDVIIAADVFIYLGKLDEIISEIKRLLRPSGVFSFSIEALSILSNEDAIQGVQREYQLEKTGRYSHSSDYIKKLAYASGFLPQAMKAIQLRMERSGPVNGLLVLWKN